MDFKNVIQFNFFLWFLFVFYFPQICNIMSECWSGDPKLRPTFKALLLRVESIREIKQG